MSCKAIYVALRDTPRGCERQLPELALSLGLYREHAAEYVAALEKAGIIKTFKIEGRPLVVQLVSQATMYTTNLSFSIGRYDQYWVTVEVCYRVTGGEVCLDRSEPDEPLDFEIINWELLDVESSFNRDNSPEACYTIGFLGRWGSLLTPAIDEWLKYNADEDLVEDYLHFNR